MLLMLLMEPTFMGSLGIITAGSCVQYHTWGAKLAPVTIPWQLKLHLLPHHLFKLLIIDIVVVLGGGDLLRCFRVVARDLFTTRLLGHTKIVAIGPTYVVPLSSLTEVGVRSAAT